MSLMRISNTSVVFLLVLEVQDRLAVDLRFNKLKNDFLFELVNLTYKSKLYKYSGAILVAFTAAVVVLTISANEALSSISGLSSIFSYLILIKRENDLLVMVIKLLDHC